MLTIIVTLLRHFELRHSLLLLLSKTRKLLIAIWDWQINAKSNHLFQTNPTLLFNFRNHIMKLFQFSLFCFAVVSTSMLAQTSSAQCSSGHSQAIGYSMATSAIVSPTFVSNRSISNTRLYSPISPARPMISQPSTFQSYAQPVYRSQPRHFPTTTNYIRPSSNFQRYPSLPQNYSAPLTNTYAPPRQKVRSQVRTPLNTLVAPAHSGGSCANGSCPLK